MYNLKCIFMLWRSFVFFYLFSDLNTTVTYVLMDNFCPCLFKFCLNNIIFTLYLSLTHSLSLSHTLSLKSLSFSLSLYLSLSLSPYLWTFLSLLFLGNIFFWDIFFVWIWTCLCKNENRRKIQIEKS